MGKLDPTSFVPLYQQLKDMIMESIDNNTWNPGDRIYSEQQLSNQFTISRNTAKKALDDLVQEGVLYRIQGKGTFLSYPKIEQSLSAFYSFSQVLKDKGLKPNDIILEIKSEKATHKIAKALQITKGEEVIMLQRLRCANNEPIILESSYFPRKCIDDTKRLALVGEVPLYDVLRNEFGIIVNSAKETFEPILINEEANHLDVKTGSPALLLERIAFDPSKNR